MIRSKLISRTVARLLSGAAIDRPPVDVKALAEANGAVVISEPEPSGSSGFLYRAAGARPLIGVNSNHPPTRRRFTIAHELGHLLLHANDGVHFDEVVVKLRAAVAGTGTDEHEIEANRFAAELLMPAEFLESDLSSIQDKCADDEAVIAQLAKRYGVSPQAMAIRLSSLGLVLL